MNLDPLPRKLEMAFQSYLGANRTAELPAGFAFFESQRAGERKAPCCVVDCARASERAQMPGRGVYDAQLSLWIGTSMDDTQPSVGEAPAIAPGDYHQQVAGNVIGILNQRKMVAIALSKPTGLGAIDSRPVKDFHVYDYFLEGVESKNVDRYYATVYTLKVICMGMDWAAL